MRFTLLILVLFFAGCDWGAATNAGGGPSSNPIEMQLDPRPAFVLDAAKPFVIELGRGSGWDGLDIIKVNETGAVKVFRRTNGQDGESTSLQLSSADMATLVDLVNTNQLTSMGRMYSDPSISDGTQWVLWIEQSPSAKSIYFNNAFPSQIMAYSNRLDSMLQKSGLNTAIWSSMPRHFEIESALWSRIK